MERIRLKNKGIRNQRQLLGVKTTEVNWKILHAKNKVYGIVPKKKSNWQNFKSEAHTASNNIYQKVRRRELIHWQNE